MCHNVSLLCIILTCAEGVSSLAYLLRCVCRTVDGLYKGMGTSKEEITAKWKNEERYMQIGGNVQGYRRHTQAYKDIVETVVKVTHTHAHCTV